MSKNINLLDYFNPRKILQNIKSNKKGIYKYLEFSSSNNSIIDKRINELNEQIKKLNLDETDLLFSDNPELVLYSIINGIDINTQLDNGDTALIYFIKNNLLDNAIIVIYCGISLDIKGEYGDTALIEAIKKNNISMVKHLLTNNANIDIQGNFGRTPIMVSIMIDNNNIFRLLLNYCDINTQDNYGNNALMYVVQYGNTILIKELGKLKNVNFNIQCMNGYTPLIYSILLKKNSIAEKIIDINKKSKKINLNIQDNSGNTALLHATKLNNKNIVKRLVKENSKIDIKNNNGENAINISKEKKYLEIYDIFEKN